ncbi:MAG: type VI secretion system tube protein Hcp [Desulfobacterales bacterium]|nr:type VI secretion system tube protein Hcp [Desulfobacterales bacterium]MDD4073222.1 type VI secretion system tube protein Hcp [Desulfobacterales bacterium]MDD4393786.1 type VI secretion system tube protein Hcp [Desulfobacterales bacterium]
MSSNTYIKFDTVKGESTDKGHADWIEILSWSHSFSQPASPIRSSAGSTVERAQHSDLNISKYIDSATDDLLGACWKGKQFEKVTLECFKSDGDNTPLKFLEIDLEDVIVSNFSISGGGGSLPMESISLSYSKVQYIYNAKNKDKGEQADGAQPISHDLKTNEVA